LSFDVGVAGRLVTERLCLASRVMRVVAIHGRSCRRGKPMTEDRARIAHFRATAGAKAALPPVFG
jgi:hypothetical protein